MPSALERTGDFSQTRTADGRPIVIYDPTTTRLVNGQYVRDQFPGNVIPAARLDSAALALLQRVPMPNAPGIVNNFLVPENSRADKYDQHVFKIDQVVNGNHRFFTRFVRNKRTEINDPAGFPVEASPWYQHGRMNVGVSGEATSVLSPSVVLNSRVGFIRHDFYIQLHGDGVNPATLGFPSSYASQVARQTFPQINYEGYSAFGSRARRRQPVHDQRHVVVVGNPEHDARHPLTQVRRRVPRHGQRPAESDVLVGELHVQPQLHPPQRQRRGCRFGERPRNDAARLCVGHELRAHQPAPGLSQQLLRHLPAGRLADDRQADGQPRATLGLRVPNR